MSRDFVDLRWSAAPSSGEARPQWVEDLLAVEVTRYREDAQRRAAAIPVSVMGFVILRILVCIGALKLGRKFMHVEG